MRDLIEKVIAWSIPAVLILMLVVVSVIGLVGSSRQRGEKPVSAWAMNKHEEAIEMLLRERIDMCAELEELRKRMDALEGRTISQDGKPEEGWKMEYR